MNLKSHLLLLLLSCVFTTQVQAEELPSVETSPWTVRAGVRTLGILSLKENLEVAYRFPDKHWEMLLHGSSPLPNLSYSSLQVGARYYFNPDAQDFNYFAMARAGVYVFDAKSIIYNPNGSTLETGSLEYNPDIALGLGVDWNWTEHMGLTGGIYGGYPYFFFPELALKYTF